MESNDLLKSLHLRPAVPTDASALAQVKDALWPDETTPPDYIAQIIAQPDHHTIAALVNEQIVGFVDGFITLASSGRRRWEVDLLGVQPAHAGHGIGTKLVRTTLAAGQQRGAELARGLVAVANIGSQKAFARAEFVKEERPFNLWVSSVIGKQLSTIGKKLRGESYLIPVMTLNYRGVWLEGEITVSSLRGAQAVCVRQGWDVTGVLIPVDVAEQNEIAYEAGYSFVNQFQWWQRPL